MALLTFIQEVRTCHISNPPLLVLYYVLPEELYFLSFTETYLGTKLLEYFEMFRLFFLKTKEMI
jgi:hypothetical protein